jgi:hypothetical protein
MPFKKITNIRHRPESDLLRDKLIAEWNHPTEGDTSKPQIFQKGGGRSRDPIHLYVIWEDWADIPASQRSEIVMDAAEAVMDKATLMQVTVAFGLTQQEADRLGLKFE